MKMAFDAKRIVSNGTGLGNYSRYVIDVLCRHFGPYNTFALFTPTRGKEEYRKRLKNYSCCRYKYPQGAWKMAPAAWRSWGMTYKLAQYDLYHGLSNELPLNIQQAEIPTVLTMHDLIYKRYPQYYKPIDRAFYDFKYRRSCQAADRIIAVSEQTKHDLIHFYHINEAKIDVVYQGCDPIFATTQSAIRKQEIRTRYNLPERFMLYVGTIEERKNLKLAVNALKLMRDTDISLVAVGRSTSYAYETGEEAARLGVAGRLKMLSGVPLADLACFYQMASLFVYPSRFEGFGIPIVEALTSGVPVIAAKGSCLEEAGGPSSLYVNPDDAPALADYADMILSDTSLANRMIADGKEYVARFDDQEIALCLMETYNRV